MRTRTIRVSALEAFHYAQRKTTDFFETQKRLATEHAVLEDTGKGEGEHDPTPESGEGRLAAAFPLVRLGANAAAARDPAKRPLLERKEQLEQAIDQLKYEKAAMAARRLQEAAHHSPAGARQNPGGAGQVTFGNILARWGAAAALAVCALSAQTLEQAETLRKAHRYVEPTTCSACWWKSTRKMPITGCAGAAVSRSSARKTKPAGCSTRRWAFRRTTRAPCSGWR